MLRSFNHIFFFSIVPFFLNLLFKWILIQYYSRLFIRVLSRLEAPDRVEPCRRRFRRRQAELGGESLRQLEATEHLLGARRAVGKAELELPPSVPHLVPEREFCDRRKEAAVARVLHALARTYA